MDIWTPDSWRNKENLLNSCAGIKKDVKINAGPAFSGRQYELVRIKK